MARCDVFVVLSHVQYMVRGFQNRNKIRTRDGWMWLTVPVRDAFGKRVVDVEIDNSKPWRRRHLRAIKVNYGGTPFFNKFFRVMETAYSQPWSKLWRLDMYLIRVFLDDLDINLKVVESTRLKPEGVKTDMLVDICKKVGADTYLSGVGAKAYMEKQKFEREGIKVEYQQFEHPVYKQKFQPFISHMSIIDAFFNIDAKGVRELVAKDEDARS